MDMDAAFRLVVKLSKASLIAHPAFVNDSHILCHLVDLA